MPAVVPLCQVTLEACFELLSARDDAGKKFPSGQLLVVSGQAQRSASQHAFDSSHVHSTSSEAHDARVKFRLFLSFFSLDLDYQS